MKAFFRRAQAYLGDGDTVKAHMELMKLQEKLPNGNNRE